MSGFHSDSELRPSRKKTGILKPLKLLRYQAWGSHNKEWLSKSDWGGGSEAAASAQQQFYRQGGTLCMRVFPRAGNLWSCKQSGCLLQFLAPMRPFSPARGVKAKALSLPCSF